MTIEKIDGEFCVCKVSSSAALDLSADFCFVGKTDRELSLVCRPDSAPADTTAREDGWRAFRVSCAMDFSLVGILSEISGILAKAKISIFAVSTFDTDYILVKAENYERALKSLQENGWRVE